MSDIIDLEVDESSIIPLEVESSGVVPLDVSETFVNVGANLQANKNASPAASQVIVTPDPGYDAMEKVTVEAMPQGALSPIDIDFDDDTGAFTAEARVGTSGYISDNAFVGGGFQLDTQAAATITPSNVQQQAVAAHKYTKGAVVVAPIPSEYIVPSGTKNITENGNNQDVKAYEKVNVSVPNSYSASDEGKVVSNGALVSQTSDTVTANDTYDTTLINSLTVNVSGGGGLTLESALDGVIAGEITTYDHPTRTTLVDSMFRANFWNKITTFKAHAVVTANNYSMYGIGAKNVAFPNLTALNGAFNSCAKIEKLDIGAGVSNIVANAFNAANNLDTLILRRSSSIVTLAATSAFSNNHFKNNGTGGTIYIPKALYDHLGDNSSLDYKKATNWITVNGYGTITWAKIEGSIYETNYADGTPIS